MTGEQRRQHSRADDRLTIVVELAVEVPAPANVLFEYLADPENNPEWNWAIRSVTPIPTDRPGEGARFSQERVTATGGADLLEVTRYEPDLALEVAGTIEEGQVTYRYQLASLNADTTRLTIRVALIPSEPVKRPDLFTARLCAAVSTNLETLRERFRQLSPSHQTRAPSR